jgi:hypothetical protein
VEISRDFFGGAGTVEFGVMGWQGVIRRDEPPIGKFEMAPAEGATWGLIDLVFVGNLGPGSLTPGLTSEIPEPGHLGLLGLLGTLGAAAVGRARMARFREIVRRAVGPGASSTS